MSGETSVVAVAAYQDRRGGLIGFGILMSAYVHRDVEFAGRNEDG